FRLYWKLISRVRAPGGRKQVPKEVRELIFKMVLENPTWGAPRIHGELLMLGFDVSERTISRWMRRAPRNPEPAKRWLAFLRNHREAIAAMDFFTMPTITFGAPIISKNPRQIEKPTHERSDFQDDQQRSVYPASGETPCANPRHRLHYMVHRY